MFWKYEKKSYKSIRENKNNRKMVKRHDQALFRSVTWKTDQRMKRRSILLIISKMQIKTTWATILHHAGKKKKRKSLTPPRVGKTLDQEKFLSLAGGNVN